MHPKMRIKERKEDSEDYKKRISFSALDRYHREVARKEQMQAESSEPIADDLMWYERKEKGLIQGVHGAGYKYNFRTRLGDRFQVDPDDLPKPLPKERPTKRKIEAVDIPEVGKPRKSRRGDVPIHIPGEPEDMLWKEEEDHPIVIDEKKEGFISHPERKRGREED